tara:strand:- start:890 stop:1000 length:111 start_codon:yes stop_codon:yes gene_type:complete
LVVFDWFIEEEEEEGVVQILINAAHSFFLSFVSLAL